MNWAAAVIHGLIWSALWGLPIMLMLLWWPQLWLHDYPPALRKVIVLPPLGGKRKAAAYSLVSIWALAVFAFLFWSVLHTYRSLPVSFSTLFRHAFTMTLLWNLLDLVILDWGVFCTWRPAFIVLPGSEGHPAYRDYRFHAIGFLKGCLISGAGAALCAAICFAVLNRWLW